LKLKYIKIDCEVWDRVGGDAAIFLGFLQLNHAKLKRDKDGFFSMDSAYAVNGLGITRRQFRLWMDKLVDAGFIARKTGRNQNIKPKYKILR